MELLQLIAIALIVLALIALSVLAWNVWPRKREHPVTIVKIIAPAVESHYPPYRHEHDRGGSRFL